MSGQRFLVPAPRLAFGVAMLCTGALGAGQATAGGLTLYEVGTADVGLASAGYNARAQDASTVLTNPAGPGLRDRMRRRLRSGARGVTHAR